MGRAWEGMGFPSHKFERSGSFTRSVQKYRNPFGVAVFLARCKGFEPLTFWSVAMDNSFLSFSRLVKKSDFMRVFQNGPLEFYHLFW